MRKLILGALAAVAVTLAIAAPNASAAWATRPVTYWDASCGRYVTTTQTYWVPDPVVALPYYAHYHHGRYHHFDHHGHDEHHGHHHR
jgi:hypothetical protein